MRDTVTPDTLDRQVAEALEWTDIRMERVRGTCGLPDQDMLFGTKPDGTRDLVDYWSTDESTIGPLLLEAQKRGWRDVWVELVDRQWFCQMDDVEEVAESLPEAVSKAFVRAAGKAGAQ